MPSSLPSHSSSRGTGLSDGEGSEPEAAPGALASGQKKHGVSGATMCAVCAFSTRKTPYTVSHRDLEDSGGEKLDAPIAISRSRREMSPKSVLSVSLRVTGKPWYFVVARSRSARWSQSARILAGRTAEGKPYGVRRASCPVKEGTVCPFA